VVNYFVLLNYFGLLVLSVSTVSVVLGKVVKLFLVYFFSTVSVVLGKVVKLFWFIVFISFNRLEKKW
jgi:hypothetical protein